MLGGETAEITQDLLLFTKFPVLLDQEYEKHNIKLNKIRIVSFRRQKWDCAGSHAVDWLSLLCLRLLSFLYRMKLLQISDEQIRQNWRRRPIIKTIRSLPTTISGGNWGGPTAVTDLFHPFCPHVKGMNIGFQQFHSYKRGGRQRDHTHSHIHTHVAVCGGGCYPKLEFW